MAESGECNESQRRRHHLLSKRLRESERAKAFFDATTTEYEYESENINEYEYDRMKSKNLNAERPMNPDASFTPNNNRRAVQVQFTTKTPRSEWEGILYYKQSAVWTLRSVANEEGGSGKIKKEWNTTVDTTTTAEE